MNELEGLHYKAYCETNVMELPIILQHQEASRTDTPNTKKYPDE